MTDTLSQADLDALFGDVEPPKTEESALSQSDLDALFGDIEPAKNGEGDPKDATDILEGLDLSQLGQEPAPDPNAAPSSGGQDLSQDEIDALLKEFLG